MRIGFRRVLTVISCLMAIVASWALPARAGQAQNCAMVLEPVGPGSEPGAVEVVPVTLGCFATYAEALAAGSGGAIQVAAGTTPASLTQHVLDVSSDTLASNVLIGTEYDDLNFASSSISYFGTATCSSTVSWQVSYVGDTWNDRFESGKGFGGCDTNKKFLDSNFGGSVLTCTPNCGGYGSLRNAVSSLKWKP